MNYSLGFDLKNGKNARSILLLAEEREPFEKAFLTRTRVVFERNAINAFGTCRKYVAFDTAEIVSYTLEETMAQEQE